MRLKVRAVAGILFSIVLLAARAPAQEAQAAGQQPEEGQTPPRPVEFSTETEAEYTDNRDSKADKEGTLDIYIRPRADLKLDSERSLLDSYYAPAVRYRSNPGPDRPAVDFFHDFGLEAKTRVSTRLVLGLSDNINQSDDPSIKKSTTSLRRDAKYLLNQAKADASWRVAPKSQVDVEGRHTYKRYSDRALWTTANEQSAVGGLSYRHTLTRTLLLAGAGRFERFDYPTGEGNVVRDFNSVLGSVGVECKFLGSLIGMLSAGWKTLDFADPELGSEAGPYGRLAVRGTVTPAVRLTSALSHTLRDSDVYPYAAQTYSSAELSVEWDLLKELMLSLTGGYRLGQYDEKTLPPSFLENARASGGQVISVGTEGGNETAVIAEAQVVCRIGQGKALRILQRYEQLDSELSESFNRNTTGLAFTMQF